MLHKSQLNDLQKEILCNSHAPNEVKANQRETKWAPINTQICCIFNL